MTRGSRCCKRAAVRIRKNDNAHVEQKNRTKVRELFGYDRIDEMEVMDKMDDIHKKWSLWNNLYSPSLKLLRKERRGTKMVKVYEKKAQTPARRLLESEAVGAGHKEWVLGQLAANDPIELKLDIEARLGDFWQEFREIKAKKCEKESEIYVSVGVI